MNETERNKTVMDLIPKNWDRRPLTVAYELRSLCENMKDHGTSIDSGTDGTNGDLWVTIDGVEWFISVRKSNAMPKGNP